MHTAIKHRNSPCTIKRKSLTCHWTYKDISAAQKFVMYAPNNRVQQCILPYRYACASDQVSDSFIDMTNTMMTSSNENTFHATRHFLRVIHRSLVNSPHKVQWRGALIFSLICAWTNGWVNNREAGDLIRHLANHDATVIQIVNHMPHFKQFTTDRE